jgi:hypothetical protein
MTSADPVLSRNGSCVVRHSKCGAPNNRAISPRNGGSRPGCGVIVMQRLIGWIGRSHAGSADASSADPMCLSETNGIQDKDDSECPWLTQESAPLADHLDPTPSLPLGSQCPKVHQGGTNLTLGRRGGNYRKVGPLYFGRGAAGYGNCPALSGSGVKTSSNRLTADPRSRRCWGRGTSLPANKTEIDFDHPRRNWELIRRV